MNILYAISTKSDLERKTFCVKIAVDLFVRSWVEIFLHVAKYNCKIVDLFVRSWVEMYKAGKPPRLNQSTSSWGRELKYMSCTGLRKSKRVDLFVRSWVEIQLRLIDHVSLHIVDLFVRSWVEIDFKLQLAAKRASRPLREVVSWNSQKARKRHQHERRPLREVVSWNLTKSLALTKPSGRPLREVVSWNFSMFPSTQP